MEAIISLDHVPFMLTADEGVGPGRDCECAIGMAPIELLIAASLVRSDGTVGGAEAEDSCDRAETG